MNEKERKLSPRTFLERIVSLLLLFASIQTSIVADDAPINLDRLSGRIYSVNFAEKSFEFISATAYDPKGNEGRTRHTVFWDDDTLFHSVKSQNDFTGLGCSLNGSFYYLDEEQSSAVKAGIPFSCRAVEVLEPSTPVTGLRRDGKTLSATFTPVDATHATVTVGGKEIPFRLGHRREVHIVRTESESFLKHEVFKARLFGSVAGDRFVVKRLRLTPLPDPRKAEDPKLPRFLMIGDSISSNYDAAARKALNGVVNYHRIDGNGGPSKRGVESIDLWLGDYRKPGFHWDIIQFNHGLHDLRQTRTKDGNWAGHAVEIDEYQKNLELVIQKLKDTGATLIWCTTTPVPNDSPSTSGRRKDEDLVYNKAALEMMKRHPEILINDLNHAVRNSPAFDEWRKGNNVHFKTDEELTVLGATVAACVKRAIKTRKATGHKEARSSVVPNAQDQGQLFDIVIYGGTSASVIAAVQAKRMGKSVIVVSPDKHLGGLSSGGLGWTDSGRKSVIGGLSREFYQRIKRQYDDPDSWKLQTPEEYNDERSKGRYEANADAMWVFAPSVADKVFEDFVGEYRIFVLREERLDRKNGVKRDGGVIRSITPLSGKTFRSRVFIDSTYEGELMAAAGVSYTVGREPNSRYGESLNGVPKTR